MMMTYIKGKGWVYGNDGVIANVKGRIYRIERRLPTENEMGCWTWVAGAQPWIKEQRSLETWVEWLQENEDYAITNFKRWFRSDASNTKADWVTFVRLS